MKISFQHKNRASKFGIYIILLIVTSLLKLRDTVVHSLNPSKFKSFILFSDLLYFSYDELNFDFVLIYDS
jgi:hypothetical protein